MPLHGLCSPNASVKNVTSIKPPDGFAPIAGVLIAGLSAQDERIVHSIFNRSGPAPPTRPEALRLGYEVSTAVALVDAVDTSAFCSEGLFGNTADDFSL